jgi:hypothetical protein
MKASHNTNKPPACTTTTPKGPALPTPGTAAKAAMQHHRVVDPDRLTSPLSADFADLVCAVCEGLPLRPMQTSCEHYFCSAEGCPEGWDITTYCGEKFEAFMGW